MITGRNDPCPCGSGRKYKKCCLNKGTSPQPTVATGTVRQPAAARVDFAPLPLSLMSRISPYVIAKMVEDPRHLDDPSMRPHIERFLRDQWSLRKVATLTTEQIEAQLRTYGVAHTRARFLELTRGRTSAWSISDAWQQADRVTCRGQDVDFLGLAACELWKRLVPDQPSVEMLDDWMQEGYVLVQQQRFADACDLWWRVWRVLQPRFTSEITTMHAVEPVFSGLQSVFNWSQDFAEALYNGMHDAPRLAVMAVEYCHEWLEQFTDEDDQTRLNFMKAFAEFQFHAGDAAAGERTLAEIVALWPDNPWSYVAVADAWSLWMPLPGLVRDDARAVDWLERGLAAVDPGHPDRDVLLQRIDAVRGTVGRP